MPCWKASDPTLYGKGLALINPKGVLLGCGQGSVQASQVSPYLSTSTYSHIFFLHRILWFGRLSQYYWQYNVCANIDNPHTAGQDLYLKFNIRWLVDKGIFSHANVLHNNITVHRCTSVTLTLQQTLHKHLSQHESLVQTFRRHASHTWQSYFPMNV